MQTKNWVEGFGRCIYCESTGDGAPLTAEHVIPQGLGGRLFISGASCSLCQEKTHKFETEALEGFLWPSRAHSGVRSKKASRRRPRLPLTIARRSEVGLLDIAEVRIPLATHPHILAMPIYAPGSLGDEDDGEERVRPELPLHTHTAANDGLQKDYSRRVAITKLIFGGHPVHRLSFEHAAFVRMLAKIAHADFMYHWRALSLREFQPLLRELVTGTDTNFARYIGGNGQRSFGQSISEKRHRMRFQQVSNESAEVLVTEIQLFSPYAMPIYRIATAFRVIFEEWEDDDLMTGLPPSQRFDPSTGEFFHQRSALRTSATQWR